MADDTSPPLPPSGVVPPSEVVPPSAVIPPSDAIPPSAVVPPQALGGAPPPPSAGAPPSGVDPARRKRHRRIFVGITGILATAVIIASNDVLFPFILALIVAFILTPVVLWIEKRGVPRFVAILITYVVALGGLAGFFALIIPSMVSEGKQIQADMPARLKYIEEEWLPEVDRKLNEWSGKGADPAPDGAASASPAPDGSAAPSAAPPTNGASPPPGASARPLLDDDPPPPALIIQKREDGGYEVHISDKVRFRHVSDDVWRLEPEEKHEQVSTAKLATKALDRAKKYLAENTGEVIKVGQAIVGAVWRGIFTLFMTLMLAGYIMLTHEKIIDFFRSLAGEESHASFDRFLRRLERGLAGVVRGQLIICVMNGVFAAIGFWMFGLKYWPIMAILAALGSIVPIFGSIVSAIPAVAIGLTQSPGTAIAVLAWIIGIHQIEANFLNPKIIGDTAKIHPVLVVFSLIVGEHFFQITGALLAVPAMSVVQTIFLHFRETMLGIESPLATKIPTPKKKKA